MLGEADFIRRMSCYENKKGTRNSCYLSKAPMIICFMLSNVASSNRGLFLKMMPPAQTKKSLGLQNQTCTLYRWNVLPKHLFIHHKKNFRQTACMQRLIRIFAGYMCNTPQVCSYGNTKFEQPACCKKWNIFLITARNMTLPSGVRNVVW